jgi:UDP-glucose 4-epimerase
MKIVVTGGAGFIGSHLMAALAELGHSMVVIDNLSTGTRANLPENVSLTTADVQDADRLADAFAREQPTLAIHLAAQANVRRSLTDPRADAEVNVLGSLSVFRAAFGSGVRRVIFASSGGAIYGEPSDGPCRESALPGPSSPYGIAKLAAEHYGRQCAEAMGGQFVALRLANVYGPRQNPLGEAGVVSLFLSNLLAGRPSTIFGDGEQTRDFVWIGDVVDAFLKAMDGPTGVYNVGTGRETHIIDLYRCLERLTGLQTPLRREDAVLGEVRRSVLSSERARMHLGWSARRSLLDGLEETVQFVRRSAPAVARPS